ncbi:SURF1 family protein [Xanthobacter agilis]|uniref:SURF1-like protein n=1 Tax=Xanthobacter agilis TaxID=47492 RepID=A0ABU0LCK5_XANAG|nr:SURF1 family protein [Xanthobacter agilis]MDQ0504856.1 surfeit locus 1 family protein [Xanthobacter agilis]
MRRRGWLVAPATVAVACLLLVGLGTWQMQRGAWKAHLIGMVAARAHAPAQEVPPVAQWPALTRDGDEYRHVHLRGVFDHARETLVFTVRGGDAGPPQGPGALVITPLMRADGPPILVNRGFVPEARRDPATRPEGQVAGEVEITGLLRLPEEASWFVPDNDAARGAFYRRDPASIAAARGVTGAAPFIIDLDAGPVPGGLPVAGATRLSFPDRHLEYALTWYGLAATLLAVSLAVWVSRRSRQRGKL